VQAEAGLDVSVSAGAVNKVVRAAESLDQAASERQLTDQEQRTILEGGAHLALNPPAIIPHLGLAFAPFQSWEVGVRFAASGWRLGVRRQLLAQAHDGCDLTIGIGVGRAAFTPPIHEAFDTLVVDDFSRWNLDLPVAIGKHGSWYRWWAGPRLVYSNMSQTMTLSLPYDVSITGSVSGHAFYVGGYAGTAFGYRSVFVGPELTLVQLIGDADVSVLGSTTRVHMSSFIVYPAFALMGEF
jgi:hypothetical protein